MNVLDYRVEYAVTGRACCKELLSCRGATIEQGSLRLGCLAEFNGGEHASWNYRHWGCVPERTILSLKLQFSNSSDLSGFDELGPEDQAKVSRALELGHVAEEDLPEGARPVVTVSAADADLVPVPTQVVSPYRIEYAPSGHARCKGPKPCNGTPVRSGTLRFGVMVTIYFNTNWHWKHWGCVTKRVINNMKKVLQRPQDLDGYSDLRHEDQDKVVAAWDAGHVADEDIPDTARKHPLIPATVDQEAALPAGSIKIEEDGLGDIKLVGPVVMNDDPILKEKIAVTKKPRKRALPKKKKPTKKSLDDDDEHLGDASNTQTAATKNTDDEEYNPKSGAKRKRPTRAAAMRKKPKVESNAKDD